MALFWSMTAPKTRNSLVVELSMRMVSQVPWCFSGNMDAHYSWCSQGNWIRWIRFGFWSGGRSFIAWLLSGSGTLMCYDCWSHTLFQWFSLLAWVLTSLGALGQSGYFLDLVPSGEVVSLFQWCSRPG